MSGLALTNDELSFDDLLKKSSGYKNLKSVVNALMAGRLVAWDPDQGLPVVPVNRLRCIGKRYDKKNSFIIILHCCPAKRS